MNKKKMEGQDDEPLRELFSAAREADSALTPDFQDLLQRAGERAPRRRLHLRPFSALAAASLASVALAAFVWLHEPARQPAPPPPPPPAPLAAEQPVAPPPAPEVEAVPMPAPPPPAPRVEAVPVPPSPKPKIEFAGAKAGTAPAQPTDEFITDVSVGSRFYQNVLTMTPGVQDSDGDGNAGGVAGGVPGGVAPEAYTERVMARAGRPNPNSIEEMQVIARGAGVEFGRAQGGFSATMPAKLASLGYVSTDLDDALAAARDQSGLNTEGYNRIKENEFLTATENPLSTFSIDVDTASYSNVRRYLEGGQPPPRDAVRIEELINYFQYDYPEPAGDVPFSVHAEVSGCPWNDAHRLVKLGLKGREIDRGETAGSNLVFLIDVSGSMKDDRKLPLLKKSLPLLVQALGAHDQVAIVVYAGASGLVLPSTSGSDQEAILSALERLEAGGSTNGGEGLALAYKIARKNFIAGGVNRVILATDGDFNVGVTTPSELLSLIEDDARHGIFLTVLGFGMGNYQDGTLEMLTGHGNGNYAYIDSQAEAKKVLVDQLNGTLVAIAKDVKIQLEFNPREVAAYRLIGYENRVLAKEDFNDDRKDAGEIGAGHTVTALYEIVPAVDYHEPSPVDPLKYQAPTAETDAAASGELLTVKLRYKLPDEDTSSLLEIAVKDSGTALQAASADFAFAAAVAEFGMLLRGSEHCPGASFEGVGRLAERSRGHDAAGYRREFLTLVTRAEQARRLPAKEN